MPLGFPGSLAVVPGTLAAPKRMRGEENHLSADPAKKGKTAERLAGMDLSSMLLDKEFFFAAPMITKVGAKVSTLGGSEAPQSAEPLGLVNARRSTDYPSKKIIEATTPPIIAKKLRKVDLLKTSQVAKAVIKRVVKHERWILGRFASAAGRLSAASRRLQGGLKRLVQRRRIYMHRADQAVDGVLGPTYDWACKRLRTAKARLGLGPAVPARWGEPGCRGMSDFHRAPVKGFRFPADVAAYRSGGDPVLSLNMPRMLNSRRGCFRFDPKSLPVIPEDE